MTFFLRLGTRGSPLALAQAHETRRLLAAAHGVAEQAIEIRVIRTTGDAIHDRPLAEAGGKGLFTRELDTALLEGAIDIAVHSAKDVPTMLEEGLALAGYLTREDVRDAFICKIATTPQDLPDAARIGSASLRRQAQLLRLRPDFTVGLLRGNVQTRLDRVNAGAIDATLLALAGLRRLGLAQHATSILPVEQFLPACGQGAIAIGIRENDETMQRLLAPILHPDTGIAVTAERAFLAALDGSCRTPIAGYATVTDGRVRFRGELLSPDGRACAAASREGAPADAVALGRDAAQQCRAEMAARVSAT